MKSLFIMMILLASASGDETSQTDWSGGGGFQGPVSIWTDQFYLSDSVTSSIPEEILLGVSLNPLLDTIPFIHTGCNSIPPVWGDVNDDGFTDFIGLSSGLDSIYWRENPGVPGAEWIRHHVWKFEEVKDFCGLVYEDEFTGIVVGYTDPWEDEIVVDILAYYLPGSWHLYHIGFLGDDNYPLGLTTGDLDGNGLGDIVGWLWASDAIVVWWDCVPGDFEFLIGPHCPSLVELHDCDGDGDCELFVETSYLPSSRIYWNNGTSFTVQYIGDLYYTGAKAVADLDGGAYWEVAFVMFSELYIYRYTAGSGWDYHFITDWAASPPRFTDLNEDGEMDLMIYRDNELAVLYNMGQGQTWLEARMNTGIPGGHLVFTDINGDSDTDFTLHNSNYGEIVWFDWEGCPFYGRGYLESTWLDPEMDSVWDIISFGSNQPDQTDITVAVRTADDIADPPRWSPELESGADISPYCSADQPYFQYRLNLYSNDPEVTPSVTDVSLEWTTSLEGSSISVGTAFRPVQNPSNRASLLVSLPADGDCFIEIYDIAGRKIVSTEHTFTGGIDQVIQLPVLPAGLYHSRLVSPDSIHSTRFVITAD